MDSTLLTTITAGAVALIVQGIGVILLRRSPVAPERQAYIGDLQGRNALLERENEDYEQKLKDLTTAFEEHKKTANDRLAKVEQRAVRAERRVSELEAEVRRLERENLDFYRRYPELERRSDER